jgi:hypothetical protein
MLEQDEIDHLCVGLNLNQGTWDYDILANEWEPLDLLEWGFTESQLMGTFEEKNEDEKKDKASKKDKKTTCPMCSHEF